MSDFGGISTEEALARHSRMFGHCQHDRAEPVVLVTGEVVASVCSNCLTRLPAGWGCDDCDYDEVRTFGRPEPIRYLTRACPSHRGQP